MKNDELDHILSLCKEVQQKRVEKAGELSVEKLKAGFRAKRQEAGGNYWPVLRIAAIFVLVLAAGAILLRSLPEKKNPATELYADIAGMFEPDVRVVMIDDEVITCEPEADRKWNGLTTYNVSLPDGKMLTFRSKEEDTLSLDSGNVKGDIVVSRADAGTMVIDITLNITGKKIRKIVVIDA